MCGVGYFQAQSLPQQTPKRALYPAPNTFIQHARACTLTEVTWSVRLHHQKYPKSLGAAKVSQVGRIVTCVE